MKARILAISPYEALQNLVLSEAAKRNDVEIIPILGDLSEGDALLERVQAVRQRYDVIISRGGTCRVLKPLVNVPVLEITSSGFDLLRTVRLIRNYEGKFAIVGFPSTGDSARMICDMMEMKIDIFIVNNPSETESCIRELIRQNYKLVVGGVTTVTTAQALGISGLLITSGVESVAATLEEAVRLCNQVEQKTLENSLMRSLIEDGGRITVFYDSNMKLVAQAGAASPAILTALKRQITPVLNRGEVSVHSANAGKHYSIIGKRIELDGASYAAFSVSNVHVMEGGIQSWVSTRSPSLFYGHSYNLLNGCGYRINQALEQAQAYARLRSPVIIRGEIGTGKESMMYKLHTLSNKSNSDLITIHVPNGNREGWKKLLEHPDSPLNQMGYGICFKDAQEIPAYIQQPLMEYLRSTAKSASNRLYFTWVAAENDAVEANPFYRFLLDELGALALSMPALRERPEDIPSFLSILINEYNSQFSKQVFGFEQEALACMQAYTWPLNFLQFKQLVSDAILLCPDAYVAAEAVERLIQDIHCKVSDARDDTSLNLNRTLDEINEEIIRLVLKDENYNYSRTAARLGISRSSLWRKTKHPVN